MNRRVVFGSLGVLGLLCFVAAIAVPPTDRILLAALILTAWVLFGVGYWGLMRTRAERSAALPAGDTSAMDAERLAAGVDALSTLAGAGMAYRRNLEELGYSPTVAEQLAAAAVFQMQDQAFRGGQ